MLGFALANGIATMAKTAKVTIDLNSGLTAEIEQAIKAGDYSSASDVVQDALRLWQASRDNAGLTDDEIGALWDAGITSGPGRFANIESLLTEAERRSGRSVIDVPTLGGGLSV